MTLSLSRLHWRANTRACACAHTSVRPVTGPSATASRWLANGAAVCAHTGPITAAEAESLLLAALRVLQPEIRKIVHVSLTAGQEAALLDFAFNLGVSALAGSTLLRQLNAGQGAVARNQLLLWNHMHKDGQLIISPGLTRRRHAEWLVWAGQPFV